MSDVPPPGGYPEQPQQPGGYQPPPGSQPPPPYQPPAYQPPQYQQPQQPQYQQPQQPQYVQQPQQFQPIGAPSNKSGNGCLKAFLIVLAITVVLGIIGTVALFAFASKVVDEAVKSFGVADTKDYDVTIDEGSCKIDTLGSMSSSGVFTNKANRRQAYNLTVDYYDNSNTKLKTDSFVATGALDKDAKTKWTSTTFNSGTLPDSITCKVSQVNYTIS